MRSRSGARDFWPRVLPGKPAPLLPPGRASGAPSPRPLCASPLCPTGKASAQAAGENRENDGQENLRLASGPRSAMPCCAGAIAAPTTGGRRAARRVRGRHPIGLLLLDAHAQSARRRLAPRAARMEDGTALGRVPQAPRGRYMARGDLSIAVSFWCAFGALLTSHPYPCARSAVSVRRGRVLV